MVPANFQELFDRRQLQRFVLFCL